MSPLASGLNFSNIEPEKELSMPSFLQLGLSIGPTAEEDNGQTMVCLREELDRLEKELSEAEEEIDDLEKDIREQVQDFVDAIQSILDSTSDPNLLRRRFENLHYSLVSELRKPAGHENFEQALQFQFMMPHK